MSPRDLAAVAAVALLFGALLGIRSHGDAAGLRYGEPRSGKRGADAVVLAQATNKQLAPELIARGRKLARRSGCAACHSLDGRRRPGPTWQGLYGRERRLADGRVVVADESYIRRSILTPNADIAEGFPKDLMPKDYGKKLSEEKIRALIELIKSVGNPDLARTFPVVAPAE